MQLEKFQVAKVFKDNTRHITSLDYSDNGDLLVTCSEDESIRIYNCLSGKLQNTIYSKKYGCGLTRFTHSDTTLLYSSTKQDDGIRYMSLHDNRYLRYFIGHKAKVVGLEINPANDMFVSCDSQTVRLWDLGSPKGVVSIQFGASCVAFDQAGLVFAVGVNSSQLLLYAVGKYQDGPFKKFTILDPTQRLSEWTKLEFSNDGKFILISTKGPHYLVDAFTAGNVKCRFQGHQNQQMMPLEACLSPDGLHCVSGSQDGTVHIYRTSDGKLLNPVQWHHDPVKVVKVNPQYQMMASADSNLAFWIPPL
ncbi:WD40-repeat-containing domain protein [Gorgonomyces haynaldii]|nr:WD40-repeat-containing domain protein [Gorgonomyces haynaldii]